MVQGFSEVMVNNVCKLLIMLCLLVSCQQKPEVQSFDLKKGILVRITNPAGSISPFINNDFLPPPFNIGEYKNNRYQFIVLSPAIKKGKAIRIMPIATVELRDTSLLSSYIVSIPADSTYRNLKLDSYGTLVSDYPYIKDMIENWLLSQQDLVDIRLFWRSEQLSLELLNKK